MAVGGAQPLRGGDPAELGGVELLGRLGEGGMGVVYLGRTAQGQLVAVKAIRDGLADDPGFRRRFRGEVIRAQEVPPYCTAEVLAADPDSDPPYLVVEYVDGPTLAEVVSTRGPLSPANLHSVAIGVATALNAIHGAGVIHRDLKPGNVLMAQGSLKVIDFGIARPVAEASTLTDANEIVGTVAYMAPERFGPDGNRRLTPAADVFAWGAVVAFAGTGHPPFRADSVPAIAVRIVEDEPELDGLPAGLRDLVARALAKDPGARPTARALLDALTATGAPAAVPAMTPPVAAAAAAAVPPVPVRSAATTPLAGDAAERLPAPVGGRGWRIAAGVVSAVLVLMLAVAIATGVIPVPFGHASANSGGPTDSPVATGPATSGTVPATASSDASTSPGATSSASPGASPSASSSASADLLAGLHRVLSDPLSPPTQWQSVEDGRNKASCAVTAKGLVVTRGTDGTYRCPGPKPLLYDAAVFVDVELLDPASCATIWLRFNAAGYAVRVCADGYHPVVHGYPNASDATPVCDPVPSPLAVNQRIRVGVVLRGSEFTFLRDGVRIGRGSCIDTANLFRVGNVVLGIFPSLSLTSAAPTSRVRLSNVEIWGTDT